MNKLRIYTLDDIKKLLVFTPPLFILVLASSAMLLSFYYYESQKKQAVLLLEQESTLKQQFLQESSLERFINESTKAVQKSFIEEEKELKQYLYETKGFLKALQTPLQKLRYLQEQEVRLGISFVLFEKESFELFYGKKNIQYVQAIIFNESLKTQNLKHVVRYIYSQGRNNLQYWQDDRKRTIRLSFFDALDERFYIGAFSTVDDIRFITKMRFVKNLAKQKSHFWLYDYATKELYNYYNKDSKKLLTLEEQSLQKEFKPFLQAVQKENIPSFLRYLSRYDLLLGIKPDISFEAKLASQVEKIKQHYFNKQVMWLALISSVALVLIVASVTFSNFLKRVIALYNRRLELKKNLLAKWKKRYELAIIASNDGLWDIDFEEKKLYFSNKWLEMFGYESNDINSYEQWFERVHPQDKSHVQEAFNKHLAGELEHFISEYRLQTKNSGYKWVLARGKVFKSSLDKPKRMLMMSMDIDTNKQMYKALLDVELLVKEGKIVIFKARNDERLSIEYISESIKSYGYAKGEFESGGLDLFDIVSPEDKNSLQAAINAALKQGLKSFSKIYKIIDTAGKERWIFNRTILIEDDFFKVTHFYGYIHDITQIKLSEEELKEQVAFEVEKNQKNERLLIQQSKLAAMGEMLGSIAHQWRQPLNNVNLILHFLRDSFLHEKVSQEKIERFVQRGLSQIEYMSQTIEDFRNFYKPSKEKSYFDVKEATLSAFSIVKQSFEDKGIVWEFQGAGKEIKGYENEFKQAILNILNNAQDAIVNKQASLNFEARVEVCLEDEKKLLIRNNGGPASAEVLERMFEPYFTTKFETQGTGIGLYMSKMILEESMQAKLLAKNTHDGMEFEIILPLK